MGIEEKARAYDEALERAKKYNIDDAHACQGTIVKLIFPELKESEDEKIMKRIHLCLDECVHSDIIRDYERDECLTYLEKQKESLHISETCKENADSFTDEDERIRKELIEQVQFIIPDKSEFDEEGNILPAYKQRIDKYVDCLEKQKPAKWSEDIKTNLDRALQIVKAAKGNLQGYQSDDGIYECDKAIETIELILQNGIETRKPAEWNFPYGVKETVDKLIAIAECLEMDGDCLLNGHTGTECGKFLRELARKQVECKSVEWSEEDEDMRDTIIRDLKRLGGDIVNIKSAYKAEIDWLKSLGPSWKPSEEQMEALRRAVNKLAKSDVADSVRLSIMFDNLKKLM